MNGILKILVATACVAVIAFVGSHFWKERQERISAERTANASRCIENRELLEAGNFSFRSEIALKASIRMCVRNGVFSRDEVKNLDLGNY